MIRLVAHSCLLFAFVMPRPAASGENPPATIALVLDTSGSINKKEMARTQEIAAGVLKGLPGGSEIVVFTFDDESRLVLRTDRAEDVRHALTGLKPSGRYTALHDALYDASRYLRDAPGGKKAIVLITDGKDENSSLDLDDGLKIAQESQIPVFAIGIGRIQERTLRRIAKLTGGSYLTSGAARGESLAARILETAPAAATPALVSPGTAGALGPAPPPPAARPSPAARRPAPTGVRAGARWWPWASLGLILMVVAGLILVVQRQKRKPRCPTCGRELSHARSPCRFCRSAAAAAPQPQAPPVPATPAGLDDTPIPAPMEDTPPPASEESTLVMRIPDEAAGQTLVLREWAVLAVTKGPAAGQVFELSRESATSIGRGYSNDIVLDDASVSSQHCRIRPESTGFVLHDLDSTNGTFVNERRTSRHLLAEGDVIRLGETAIEFRTDQRRG